MSAIVVGIDGGGSKTRAIVADEQGKWIADVVGPGSAVRPGRHEHSADVVAEVVRDALASCDMTHVRPRVLCVGVAGVGREPEREAFHRNLILGYAEAGEKALALRQYHACRAVLRRELGVEASPQTRALYQLILEDKPLPRREVATAA